MKNRKIWIIILMVIFILSIAGIYALKNEERNTSPLKVPVSSDELITKSVEEYNTVEVYQQNNTLVINASSESEFFEGAQFLVDTQGEISPSDIEIIWTTLGGGTERTEKNERIIAEIKIKENNELIFDKKINFLKKAFDAVEDVLEKSMKK